MCVYVWISLYLLFIFHYIAKNGIQTACDWHQKGESVDDFSKEVIVGLRDWTCQLRTPPQEVQLNGCQFCRILVLQICGCLSSWIGGRRIRSHRFTIYGHQTSCFPSHQILGTHLIPEYFRQNPEITHRKCWLSNFAQTNDKTQKVRLSGITYSQHIKHDKNPWSHGSWIEFWSILIHTICSCKKNTGLFSQQRLNMELLWAGLTRT